MISNIIHFYGGGITVSEAKSMPLSELDRYLTMAAELNERIKAEAKKTNGI